MLFTRATDCLRALGACVCRKYINVCACVGACLFDKLPMFRARHSDAKSSNFLVTLLPTHGRSTLLNSPIPLLYYSNFLSD